MEERHLRFINGGKDDDDNFPSDWPRYERGPNWGCIAVLLYLLIVFAAIGVTVYAIVS